MIKKWCLSGLVVALSFLMVACADPEERLYTGLEAQSLKLWMEKYHPDLVQNHQVEGDYYIDVINPGDGPAAQDTVYWVRMEFTGRDLAGNVCLTRDELTARQIGTFTKHTHYVPFFRYCGDERSDMLDGMHLALRNKITLGEEYAEAHGLEQELVLRLGAEVVLYMPSTIVGGLSGNGGYEGQLIGGVTYTLSDQRPLIARMKVVDLVKNPLEQEGQEVDAFVGENGGLKPVEKNPETTSATRGAEEPQYNDGYAWRNSIDTIPHLYIHHTFRPELDRSKLYTYRETYRSAVAPYNNMQELDLKINQALIDRFGEGTLEGDSIKLTGTAKVWYIGRFLDGFVFDTNIDEVKEILYGKEEGASEGAAISYTPEVDQSKYVSMWYYALQQLRYGQWATVVGTSIYNYGATGKEGSTTTSSSSSNDSSYYDMLNYYNYMMMAALAGSYNQTSDKTSVELDKDRYYRCALNGPEYDGTLEELPRLKVTFSAPKSAK